VKMHFLEVRNHRQRVPDYETKWMSFRVVVVSACGGVSGTVDL
jgi:hypothetical protein